MIECHIFSMHLHLIQWTVRNCGKYQSHGSNIMNVIKMIIKLLSHLFFFMLDASWIKTFAKCLPHHGVIMTLCVTQLFKNLFLNNRYLKINLEIKNKIYDIINFLSKKKTKYIHYWCDRVSNLKFVLQVKSVRMQAILLVTFVKRTDILSYTHIESEISRAGMGGWMVRSKFSLYLFIVSLNIWSKLCY
jgi:hypothetical protein